jgi:hypothetical protein
MLLMLMLIDVTLVVHGILFTSIHLVNSSTSQYAAQHGQTWTQ